MAAMDDLKELCEHGSETIEVARDWELLSQARELLISHGYVEQEQQTGAEEKEEEGDEAQAGIIFHRASRPDSSPKSSFRFPEKAPDPQYKSSGTRTTPSKAITDWTLVKSFQHDTKQLPSKEQISIIAKTPKLNLEQIVGIRMVVQPSFLLDNAHFNVKLRVERLVVGVHTNSFLKPEKHQELGFYPYSIRLDMEPLVEGYDNLCAIPIVETQVSLQNSFPEICSSFSTTNTTVGGQIGYGPASLNISRTWGSQVGETGGKKVEVVRIDEAEGGNSASFEWSILRWASNEKYEAQKPDRGFKWNNGNLQLPFRGCAVSLESEIPDVWWKFERQMIGKVVKFRIRLQAEMHLMWWRKNSFIKSKGSLVNPFKYENVWELQQPSSE